MTGLWNDLRFALRGLARSPGFTVVAVVTLTLGIGATTAVFTLVDGVILEPLPFPDPDELVSVRHEGRGGEDQLPMSAGLYLLYADQAGSFESVAMYQPTVVNLLGDGDPERIAGSAATPSFFSVLGVGAALGRGLVAEDGVPEAEPVVVLSHAFWQSHFGSDPTIVGRTVDMSGTLRRVVGILPRDFSYPNADVQLFIPMEVDPAQAPLAAFGATGIARLSDAATLEGADTELQGLIGRLAELFPEDGAPAFLEEVKLRAVVRPLKDQIVGDVSRTLWILLGHGGPRAGHRVRQRRQPPVGARRSPPTGSRAPGGRGREPAPSDACLHEREPAPDGGGRVSGCRPGVRRGEGVHELHAVRHSEGGGSGCGSLYWESGQAS